MLDTESKSRIWVSSVDEATILGQPIILSADGRGVISTRAPLPSPSYAPGEEFNSSQLPKIVNIDENPIPLDVKRPNSFIRLHRAALFFIGQEKNRGIFQRAVEKDEDVVAFVASSGKALHMERRFIEKSLSRGGLTLAFVAMGMGVTILVAHTIKGVIVHQSKSDDKFNK